MMKVNEDKNTRANLAESPRPAHVSEFISDELSARGWNRRDLAERMGGNPDTNELALEFLDIRDPDVLIGKDSARSIGQAFGTGSEVWLNLETAWRTAIKARIQEHAGELYIALRLIFFSYEDDCNCDCTTETCCKRVNERCAKCEARAVLTLIEDPYPARET